MDDNILTFISSSEDETYSLGESIGELVEAGQIILLSGDLGAGKTVLAQGICAGLGVLEDVTSPTFNIINEYEGDFIVYHMDLYRLEKDEELYDLAIEEYLESDGVVIIEWPDLAYDLLPPDFIYIKINRISEEEREISIEGEGERSLTLLERLEEYVDFGY